jgi:tetratricopeptide (TPR) repeat protein
MTYDIFISYESTTGVGFSEHLKNALERRKGHNHKVFLANETLYGGDKGQVEIDSALYSCRYFVVIITSLTMDSEGVMREYQRAKEMNKRIIPCRYSKIPVSDTKELANIQQIDFSDKFDLANKVILDFKKIEERDGGSIDVKKDAEKFLKRGNSLYTLGKFEEAEKEYIEALRIKPDLADSKFLPMMKTFDKEVQNSLRNLTELYIIVHEIVLFSEEIDPEKKADIQAINELRHTLTHLMRVFASYFELERDYDSEYMELNLKKAFAHVYRAGYDTLDRTTLFLRQYISEEMKIYSLETINLVFPEYFKDIRPAIEELTDDIVQRRGEKYEEEPNFENFLKYANLMKTVYGYYKKVLKKKTALIAYEEKLKKKKRRKLLK